jgi:hypothetical protein
MFNSATIIIIIFLIILILYTFISYRYELAKREFQQEGFKLATKLTLQLKANQFIQPINTEFKKEWQTIITDYVNEFNQINLIARNVNTHKELIDKYSKLCLLPISEDNIKSINNMLDTKLQSNNPIYPLIEKIISKIRIVKCSNEMEMGYPHTHKNIIVFNADYFKNPSITTFIHECIHIDQRLRPEIYNKLYNDWGFVKYQLTNIDGKEFAASIIAHSRSNPDGRDINWLWISPSKQAYWIGAVFISSSPKSIADVENRIYKINNVNAGYNTIEKIGKYEGQTELIHNNAEFKSVFGYITNNNYHPNEIAAELVVNLYKLTNNKSIASKKLLEYI